jgi:hypothetical protein
MVAVAHHESARGLPYVDAVVPVGGMAQDPFVLLVKGVHCPPGKSDMVL